MKDYIVLDLETPNEDMCSISAIGIVIVKDNKEIDTLYSLINPEDYFDEYIIKLTNITPEMVTDAPKFNQYWPKIKDLLIKYPIVGHNITFDLSVISKTLTTYNLEVPEFDYYCTLDLSKKRMQLDSYALTNIMNYLEVDYLAHNALEDAKVTSYLFRYLNDLEEISIFDQKKYIFDKNFKKEVIDEITPNINEVYGLIQELRNKEHVEDKHIKLIEEWTNKNYENRKFNDINNIILKLEYILQKEEITKKDLNNLAKSVIFISKSEKYSVEELNNQILTGLMKMIKVDDEISNKEYRYMQNWLNYKELPAEVNVDEILSSLTIKK